MKKSYKTPLLEFILIEQTDIITVSGTAGDDDGGNTGAWDNDWT